MALEFVTLAEAKAHLRVTHDMDDADIRLKLRAASGAIKNYMGEFSVYEPDRNADDDPLLDSNWEPVVAGETTGTKVVRWEVRAATLIMIQGGAGIARSGRWATCRPRSRPWSTRSAIRRSHEPGRQIAPRRQYRDGDQYPGRGHGRQYHHLGGQAPQRAGVH